MTTTDTERALAAGILIDPRTLDGCIEEGLKPADLADHLSRSVYGAALRLLEADQPVDAITVTRELARDGVLEALGGPVEVSRLEAEMVSAAHVQSYARMVRDAGQVRELAAAARATLTDCESYGTLRRTASELVEDAERRVLSVGRADARGSKTMKQLIAEATDHLEAAYKRKSALLGVPTGLSELDELTSGWQAGDLIVIAARPSMGKTALVLQAAMDAATNRSPITKDVTGVALYSLEMAPDALTQRLMGNRARIDLQALRRGFLRSGDWVRLAQASSELAEAPLFIEDTPGLTVGELRARLRRLTARREIGLVVIDYLQLMDGPPEMRGQNKATEVGEISKGLKSVAREFNVPVIALSQLNRSCEARADKRPLMSDIRESGAIEQDADLIGFLYREEYYLKEKTPADKAGVCEFIVGKHRNGPTGTVDLMFDSATTRFSDRKTSGGEYV